MLELVIAGGQTGWDQLGLIAARNTGFKTGGFAPKGWLTENGPAPWLAEYGLIECPVPGYPARTEKNAAWADVTLWGGTGDSSGYWCTRNAANKHHKAFGEVGDDPAELIAKRIILLDVKVLNIAGNRGSKCTQSPLEIEGFLRNVFQIVRKSR
jgi:hypothetical protein